MSGEPKGTLIVVGGHEEKEPSGDSSILHEVAIRARRRKGPLVVLTVATRQPDGAADPYVRTFHALGVPHVRVVDVRSRDEAEDDARVRVVAEAGVVYFTGGDQLRITSQIGDTALYRAIHRLYQEGGVVAGTSAGAAAMPETMLVGGPGDESVGVTAISMAPGLGLLPGVVIDTHFAERGRISRLVGAVAQNPKNLGLGIDENTALIVTDGGRCAEVVCSGGVYVVDGGDISYSSPSERRSDPVAVHDLRLHVLASGDRFDLRRRRPIAAGG
jgi:cyanophycinase